jgi:hypothetical protein
MPSRDRDLAPGAASPRAGHARRASPAGQAGVVVHLALLVCVAAGLYIAWHQGSRGGGRGGAIAGASVLVAAVVRLAAPARLAGLLAVRRRATDVATLTVLGVALLTAGLVLPRLAAAVGRGPRQAGSRTGPRRAADEREMKDRNVEDQGSEPGRRA